MLTYRTPGVYVEEVSTGSKPIVAVGTSVAGFVGVAPLRSARLGEVVALNNWGHFKRTYFEPGAPSSELARGVYGYFENGGGRCYVVNSGSADGLQDGLAEFERVDEIRIVAAPGMTTPAAYDALLSHCEKLGDRVAILDAPRDVTNLDDLTRVATAELPTRSAPLGTEEAAEGAEPSATPPRRARGGSHGAGLRARQSEGGYGAFYFPWLGVRDPLSKKEELVVTPPSGYVAGIFARTDAQRGVHKAPANEGVRGALSLTYNVSPEEQGLLNDASVNCIRYFAREGIRVWGARTLADPSSEWRYVPVRRLFNLIESSIAASTRWVVFEPNDATLWKSIRRDVSAFLMRLWRDGALMGETPEQAFFVQCDEETNPPEVIDAGQVVTVIGVAPVKPAEFIIFRIGQTAAGAEVEAEAEA